MTFRRLLTIAVILIGLLTACGSRSSTPSATLPSGGTRVSVAGGTYTDVTPVQLNELLRNKDFFFVNTHIPYEGEIASTGAFIAFEENGPQRVNEYPADKAAKIVLYCRSGRMSAIVAEALVKAGYTNVWNLKGGMRAWEAAGEALIGK